MIRFAGCFGLKLSQPELDFVNIPLLQDLPVYLDPFAISLYDDEFSCNCNDAVVQFFQSTLDAIQLGDTALAKRMLLRLSEPNETHLGVSSGKPQGRGVGGRQALELYTSIVSSKAATSGLVSELSECDLFIDGIGPDKISDMTTNILRLSLIEYTQRQCELHSIQLDSVPSGFIWNADKRVWHEIFTSLPVYNGQKILLVPKSFVRRTLAMNSQEYLNKHVLEYLQAEHLRAGSALVEVLKNGKRRVTKKALKQEYSCSKDWMAKFSAENPAVLANYKIVAERLAVQERRREAEFLNGDCDEQSLALALIKSLEEIPPGNNTASDFHNLTKGIIEFLFWPHLINPEKEREIHDGRKRIDVMYTNSAQDGFFFRSLSAAQIAAIKVPVECKNYSKDPGNPELDQLAGRFGPNRGWIGLMIYRTTSDYELLLRRCRDTANDRRGYIMPLGDNEIVGMLQCIADQRREEIDQKLTSILDRLTC